MTKDNPIQAKAYLRNIAMLQDYIRDHDYKDGGWLPAGRKMAQLMGTSHLTYVRALKFLERESLVRPFANRGHYVLPDCLRCKKVGLILNGGEYVPFIGTNLSINQEGYRSDVSAIIESLAANNYDTQLIQMPSPQQAFEIAQAYYMQGLIWFNPMPQDYAAILEYQQTKKRLPFIVATHNRQICKHGIHAIVHDDSQQLYQRVTQFLERGHTRFAFMGLYEDLKDAGALPIIKQAGSTFSHHDCFVHNILDMGQITQKVLTRNYTGIIANGGMTTMKYLFDSLKTLDDQHKPEVLLYNRNLLSQIQQRAPQILENYPSKKIIAIHTTPQQSLGVNAVNELVKLIR